MKISLVAAAAAASLLVGVTTHVRAQSTAPVLASPIGWLSTSSNIVRVGSSPVLTWNIQYPSTVEEHVEVEETQVTPKEILDYEIRVLGAGVTTSNSNGSNLSFVPTESVFSLAGGSYERIFYGTNGNVTPTKVVRSGTVQRGEAMCFGGRYYYNRSWSTLYRSDSGTKNVRTLVNGDSPPTTYALHTAPTLENFIKPYLDGTGKVAIGPMDVIVFMELTHTDMQSTQMGYDCQDMVLLVTFKTRK